ncbi:MAG: hypothetical protein COB02_14855 [Candidatus Cloacimonadota bacterium]|nr:MAG: hypothetical protein COB02_14855 [Candidatus Cloacimonadota bacterium]
MSLKISVALSNKKSPKEAIEEAYKEASIVVKEPDLVLMFASIFYDNEEIIKYLSKKVDSSKIIGCSSFCEISNVGVSSNSLVLLFLSSEHINICQTGFESTMGTFSESEKILSKLSPSLNLIKENLKRVGIFFRGAGTAGAYEDEEVINLQKSLHPIVIFGGMGAGNYNLPLGDPNSFYRFQYFEDQAKINAKSLSIMEFDSNDIDVAFGFSHGWSKVGKAVTVTKSKGSEVFEIDGEPIFDYYKKYLGHADGEAFFDKLIQRYGFRILSDIKEEHSVIVMPVKVNFETESIIFYPMQDLQSKKVEMVQASKEALLSGARCAAKSCLDALKGENPDLLIMVSCCGRTDVLLSNVNEEVKVIQEVFSKNVPLIGYYAGGELGPLYSRFEDIVNLKCQSSGSYNYGSTIILFALKAKNNIQVEKSYPLKKPSFSCLEDENQNLKNLLKKYEKNFETTVSILNNISKENYQNIDEIEESNKVLDLSNQKNKKLQEIISRYTPHSIWKTANKLVDMGQVDFKEEKLTYCFLFMDVKGFTTFSENNCSEDVVKALNEIFTPATDIIYENNGDIDKFIGDCIFAFFKEPKEALNSAKEIQKIVDSIIDCPFKIRIGINQGSAVRANVGSHLRKEYTFIGDSVNLAQRLESVCLPSYILVSKDVYLKAKISFKEALAQEVFVKGKKEKISVYQCRD